MRDWIPDTLAEWAATLVVVVAIGAVAAFIIGPETRRIQCDGAVPTWTITEENEGTGCVEFREGAAPPDWDGSWICIGLCTVPNPSPYYPQAGQR